MMVLKNWCPPLVLIVPLQIIAFVAAGEEIQLPDRGSVLDTLRPEHPRLMVTATSFQELRALCESGKTAPKWLAKLQQDGLQLMDEPPVKYEIPDGKRLLADLSRTALVGTSETQ
ncbi:MAG: hypothetical protein R3E01_09490 [Pirellulaceae bacterium]